jgi:hypothetical protein
MMAGETGQPCEKWESPIPPMVSKVRRAGFGGKSMNVTQGELIVSVTLTVNLNQVNEDEIGPRMVSSQTKG